MPTIARPLSAYVEDVIAGRTPPPPVASLVGFEFIGDARAAAQVRMVVGEQHWNAMGTAHGGLIAAAIDAAIGVSVASVMEAGESFTTLDLQVRFIRSVRTGTLLASSKIITRTRQLVHATCQVVDADNQLVAHATSSCLARAA